MDYAVFRRGKKGTWNLRMWVPQRYRSVEQRKELFVSLKTSDQAEAHRLAGATYEAVLANMNERLVGVAGPVSEGYYRSLVDLARARGFTYRTASDLVDGPIEDLVARLNQLKSMDPAGKNKAQSDALLGTAGRPKLKISELQAFYENEHRTEVAKKNERELIKYRAPFLRAANNLIALIGDKYIEDISYDDAQAFFDHMKDRVAKSEIVAKTGNKFLGTLRTMINEYRQRYRVTAPNPFEGMNVTKGPKKSRKKVEFEDEFIRTKILGPDFLPNTNDEIRDVLIIAALTGCRHSEIYRVPECDILMDVEHDEAIYPGKVAVLRIQDEGRQIKNEPSARDVVLIEEAYDAISRHPTGFPRYRNSNSFSATAIKAMRSAGLLPTKDHVPYNLRDSFEGRMTRAGIPNRIAARMMGHSVSEAIGREVYGRDLTIDEQLEILLKIRP